MSCSIRLTSFRGIYHKKQINLFQQRKEKETMARERMVTRTITNTTYKIMCVDTTKCEVTIEQFNTTDEFAGYEKALKYFRKHHETDTKKLVKIESVETTEQLYGMPEVEFMQYAKLLPPRGTKVGAENAE